MVKKKEKGNVLDKLRDRRIDEESFGDEEYIPFNDIEDEETMIAII